MSSEPHWLSLDAVIALNRDIVAGSQEPHAVRDRAALQVAVAHPWNVFVYFMDSDLAVLGARLFTSIAGARGFAAGNKRTAFRAADTFLQANGFALELGDHRQQALDRLFDFCRGRLGQAGVVEWFRLWMTPLRDARPGKGAGSP